MLKRILYIEDDEGLARLLQKRMQRHGLSVDIALDAEEGTLKLRTGEYQLVLLDYHLPGVTGLELLDRLLPDDTLPPIIILTAIGDERVALAALDKGAADYAVKDPAQSYLDLLPAIMQAAFVKTKLARENELQRKELEAAKAKAEQASQAKSDFLATMSHEIRTPMNAVVGMAELLSVTELSERQREMVETLGANAKVLLALINDLLDISRIESGQVELESLPFSVSTLLKDIQAIFAAEAARKKLGLRLHDHSQGRQLVGDRTRLHQIVMNLVGNALKFTEHGNITVEAHLMPVAPGTSELRLVVSDTGIGISPEKLDHIFEKFVQADQSINRRFGGSGLGLAICKTLAEVMGGTLAVESTPNQGSSFIVTLRLPDGPAVSLPTPAEPRSPLAPSAEPGSMNGQPCVLLVEDYPANVLVATMMLESLGYEYQVAQNGQEAIEAFAAATRPFHAILMDVQMHGIDGYETTRRIRSMELQEQRGHHRIIGLTAHALAGDRERCLSAGMDDYMTKPIHPDLLAKKLALGGPQA